MEFIHPGLQHVTPELASRVNKWCTLSSFIPATDNEPGLLRFKTRILASTADELEFINHIRLSFVPAIRHVYDKGRYHTLNVHGEQGV